VILHVTVGGRTRMVEVSRNGDKFLVSVDGRRHDVDVKLINGVWSLLVGPLAGPAPDSAEASSDRESGPYDPKHIGDTRPTRSYEIALSASANGATTVHVNGVPVDVSVARDRRPEASVAPHFAGEGPQRVTAPMPGKIVKLLVRAGDKVLPGQGVVVVEAMKMENELRARAGGTVSEVRVTEGSSVEAGAILVILE